MDNKFNRNVDLRPLGTQNDLIIEYCSARSTLYLALLNPVIREEMDKFLIDLETDNISYEIFLRKKLNWLPRLNKIWGLVVLQKHLVIWIYTKLI